ncbi:nitrogenase-stabilizing/protective protein NifW [Frankia sp. AgB32]|uniref:nitrogenase-stabilizing/protective protein NifW n=1 Tax=Frankia sp. AgB32 TaxID=631119 RepID=UPI00201016F0|nr:nitrogenase-stabilizing/protective protein NifW [Frankia sp. AgB32]MCK9893238.1 nitrogenase-stabilizing/protective protein NifW [Frankia sp. AgB32]
MSTTTAAAQLAEFHRCTTAEQYLDLLGVAYDPRVVAVNRLHILRLFGDELGRLHDAGDGEQADPAELLRVYHDGLERCYQAFLNATALDHRVFKVLKDRAPEAAGFVPSSDITVQRPGDARPAPTAQPEEDQ